MTQDQLDAPDVLTSEALDPGSEALTDARHRSSVERLGQFLRSRRAAPAAEHLPRLRHALEQLSDSERLRLVKTPFYSFWWLRLMGLLNRGDDAQTAQWVPELARLLAAAACKPGAEVALPCRADARGELALPTLGCAIVGLPPDEAILLRSEPPGMVAMAASGRRITFSREALQGARVEEGLRRFTQIAGTTIAISAEDPWIAAHFAELNAQPAEEPYPQRDLAADLAPSASVLGHFDRALDLVETVWPALADEIRKDISCVVPFRSALMLGWADLRFRGAVFINSGIDNPIFVTERLVHEAAHVRLFNTDRVALHTDPPTRRLPSPFRNDPRPVSGLIHASFVYARLIDLFRRLDGTGHAGFGERADAMVPKFKDTVETLHGGASLTLPGRSLLDELVRRVDGASAK